MKTKTKIITSLIAILVLALFYVAYWHLFADERYRSEHCPEYEKHSGFLDQMYFIDCAGLVGIERWTDEIYPSVRVEIGESPYSFRVKKYKFQGRGLFYIEDFELNKHSTYRLNIKEQLGIDPTNKDKLPSYRKINVDTGLYTLYESIEDAPENERPIFEELLN